MLVSGSCSIPAPFYFRTAQTNTKIKILFIASSLKRLLETCTQALAWEGWGMWASVGTLQLLCLGTPSACPLRIMLLRRWMMGLLCMLAAVLLRTVRCFPNRFHIT